LLGDCPHKSHCPRKSLFLNQFIKMGKRKFHQFKKNGHRFDANKKRGGRDGGDSDDEGERQERHSGSYPIDSILSSEEYKNKKIVIENPMKRKYALCFSYVGTNYQGLQINPDAKTIEQELERALFLAGSIIEANFGFMQKIQWTRAARTDRGVHALTQCCAMKLLSPKDVETNIGNARINFAETINRFLPADIQVQGMAKVSKGFNAKNACTKRIYHYLLPTYLLQKGSVMDEKLQKAYDIQGPVKGAGYEGGYVDPSLSKSLTTDSLRNLYYETPDSASHLDILFKSYRATPERLARFQDILKKFEGTKSYHNYTTGKDATEANAKRYMLSLTTSPAFVNDVNGVEYVRIELVGQSFLLNQIRKMIGSAIEVVREGMSEEEFALSFTEPKVNYNSMLLLR
jgi:tRNA pseudouridine38-40 synthase